MVPKTDLTEGIRFSRIIYGFMNANQWELSSKKMLSHIGKIIDKGITTFDHADIYGSYTCEALFGEALKLDPSIRDRIEIITKCGIQLVSENRPNTYIKHYNSSESHIIQSVENSLNNLNTEFIDLLLFHRPDPFMDYEGIASAFHYLHKEGKVKSFGVSNFSVQQLKTLQEYLNLQLITNQIEISVYQLDSFKNGILDYCMQQHINPMAWSPLAGGRIFNGTDEKSVRLINLLSDLKKATGFEADQIAIAWLLKHPSGILPVIGTGNLNRIDSAIRAIELELTLQQWFEIYTASNGQDVP